MILAIALVFGALGQAVAEKEEREVLFFGEHIPPEQVSAGAEDVENTPHVEPEKSRKQGVIFAGIALLLVALALALGS